MTRLNILLTFISLCFYQQFSFSQETDIDTTGLAAYIDYMEKMDEFDQSIPYKKGEVSLSEKIQLDIPNGYKFIPKKESEKIIFDFWGNPESEGLLGMLVLDTFQLADLENWAFVVSEENDGYVEDEDAKDIDYDDLLEELQSEEEDINEERVKNGYSPAYTIGWASKPYYDESAKILHWAKEIKFGDDNEENTLNYDVRILGREGLLSLNAVGSISALEEVKSHIPEIIHIATFKEGHTYADFDPSVDKVAAYTIGGLVAGKLLAKAGILALLLKNIKLVALGALGLFSVFKKRIMGLFRKEENLDQENTTDSKEEEE